ncbi:putative viral A-type inclusion protein [Gregarina niphandrodes]|uniref:Viral A-type inclusion protein n=1 Tax=Gregarina niphandrodes TaxID=110365 RepID=A0A023B509_GRENI|nr:putative viral A-type inclusion protein [Gregarina niphandrodes]EZG57971.1 putative viral A-type inclusion protein [Gregarina niphandrodes]|eukprot:XP_011131000.1 putative viral A-type inclusion protein [Gregarina niphandrodes]
MAVAVGGEETLYALRQELKLLRDEYQSVLGSLELASNQLRLRNRQLERFQETNDYCQKLLGRNSRLELEIARVQDENESRIREYTGRLQGTEEEKSSLRTQVLDQRERARELEHSLIEMELIKKNNERLRSQAADLSSRMSLLKKELDEATSARKAAEEGVGSLKDEYDKLLRIYTSQLNAIGETSETVETVAKENRSLVQQVSELKERLADRNTGFQKQLTELEMKYAAADSLAANRGQQLELIESQYEKLCETLGILKSKLANQDQDKELERLQKLLNDRELEYQLRISDLESKATGLGEKLKSYGEMHAVAGKLVQRNTELERLVSELSDPKSHFDLEKLRTEKESAEATAKRYAKDIKTLEIHLASMKKQLEKTGSITREDDEELRLAIIDALKEDHKREISDLELEYNEELRRIRKLHQNEINKLNEVTQEGRIALREQIKQELDREFEDKEKSMREACQKLVDEARVDMDKRLHLYQEKVDEHHKQILNSIERQNKHRIDQLKKEATAARQRYESALASVVAESDVKMAAAAEEMDRHLRDKDEEIQKMQALLVAAETKQNIEPSETNILRLQLEQLKSEMARDREEWLTEYNHMKKKYDDLLQKQLDEKEMEIEQLKTSPGRGGSGPAIARIEELIKLSTNATNNQSRELLESLQSSKLDLEEKNTLLQRNITSLEEDITLKEKEIDSLKRSIKRNSLIASSGQNIPSMKGILKRNEELEKKLTELSERHREEISTKMKEISHLRDTLRTRVRNSDRNSIEVIEVEKPETRKVISQLHDRIKRLEESRAQLASSLRSSQGGTEGRPVSRTLDATEMNHVHQNLQRHISELNKTIEEGNRLQKNSHQALSEAVDKRVENMKLEGMVSALRARLEEQQEKVKMMEEEMDNAARSVSSPVIVDNKLTSRKEDELAIEKHRLEETLEHMKTLLATKESGLTREIENRNEQMNIIEKTNSELSKALEWNKNLQAQLKDSFDVSPRVNFEKTEQLLTTLESENSSKAEGFQLEISRLQALIKERELDWRRLKEDSDVIQEQLRITSIEKMELLDKQHNQEVSRLKRELENRKDVIDGLTRELEDVRNNYRHSKEEGELRLTELVQKVSSHFSQQELLIARIQEEKDIDTERMKLEIQASIEAQTALEAVIQETRKTLSQKEEELKDLLDQLRVLAEEMTGDSISDELDVSKIREEYSRLANALTDSRSEVSRLTSYFEQLIRKQEQEVIFARQQQRTLGQWGDRLSAVEDGKAIDSKLLQYKGDVSKCRADLERYNQVAENMRPLIQNTLDSHLLTEPIQNLHTATDHIQEAQKHSKTLLHRVLNDSFGSKTFSSLVTKVQSFVNNTSDMHTSITRTSTGTSHSITVTIHSSATHLLGQWKRTLCPPNEA